MNVQHVLKEIKRQAALQKRATEVYEIESCEILALDAILDYHIRTYPNARVFEQYPNVPDDEKWMLMNYLFTDFISDEISPQIEPDIVLLLETFYTQFYVAP